MTPAIQKLCTDFTAVQLAEKILSLREEMLVISSIFTGMRADYEALKAQPPVEANGLYLRQIEVDLREAHNRIAELEAMMRPPVVQPNRVWSVATEMDGYEDATFNDPPAEAGEDYKNGWKRWQRENIPF